jgi:hypothetical protein
LVALFCNCLLLDKFKNLVILICLKPSKNENIINCFAVSSTGSTQNKSQYTGRLRFGNFVHNNIEIEENKATISDNTATLIGKGLFTVTTSGKKNIIHLSFMEVFSRTNPEAPWKLIALKASALEK